MRVRVKVRVKVKVKVRRAGAKSQYLIILEEQRPIFLLFTQFSFVFGVSQQDIGPFSFVLGAFEQVRVSAPKGQTSLNNAQR